MIVTRRNLFVAAAVLSAAVFVRLGFWQLRRRGERRARNAIVASRLDSAAMDVRAAAADTGHTRFRRVAVRGVPDYEHEIVVGSRTHRGSPGVNLLTPVRLGRGDAAVMVNRGWVYAPDGATIDFDRWHDRDSVFSGYVDDLPATGGVRFTSNPRVVTRLSADLLRSLPYPVLPIVVVVLGDSEPAADRPARLGVPPLDEGPHLSYAIQWFAFALIALVGAGVVVTRSGGPQDA